MSSLPCRCRRHLWIVIVGVAIGIVMMRFAAQIFTRMIAWEPALEHAAYLLLFAIGGELLLEYYLHFDLTEWAQFGISIGIIVLVVLFARVKLLRPLQVDLPAICAAVRADQRCAVIRVPHSGRAVPPASPRDRRSAALAGRGACRDQGCGRRAALSASRHLNELTEVPRTIRRRTDACVYSSIRLRQRGSNR